MGRLSIRRTINWGEYQILALYKWNKYVKKWDLINEHKEEFFSYHPKYIKVKKRKVAKKLDKDNPFDKLSELRLR